MQRDCFILGLVVIYGYALLNPKADDIILWESFLNDNAASLGELFKKYYSSLFQYGTKQVRERAIVEDAIQELFLDLWRNKNPIPNTSIKAYLFKALKYKLLKQLANHEHQSLDTVQQDHLFEIPYEAFLISAQDNKERTEQVLKALQQLSNRQKEVIYLKFYQELEYEEIGQIMNINYQATRNLMYQAVKSLRKLLSNFSSQLKAIL